MNVRQILSLAALAGIVAGCATPPPAPPAPIPAVAVPFPAPGVPTEVSLAPPPREQDDLSRFRGYDAVIVTYTSGEAAAMATLLTPHHPLATWYEYRHNADAYAPKVTVSTAPFNYQGPGSSRYYHSLGLYYPITIGRAHVLLFKSGLHLDQDGPAAPVRDLLTALVATVQPRIFITTGTAGAIGANVHLGDVVIAGTVRFHCTGQFADSAKFPWNQSSYTPNPVSAQALEEITPVLTRVNAALLQDPSATGQLPAVWSAATDSVVTTDHYEFDDTQNLQGMAGLGRACEMGDAMVGDVMQGRNLAWYVVRNCSDPQIDDLQAAQLKETPADLSRAIAAKNGELTTAASLIACWAIVDAACNH